VREFYESSKALLPESVVMKIDLSRLSLSLFCVVLGLTSSAVAQDGLKPLRSDEPARLVAADEESSSKVEVIKERYTDGNVKVEREVIRDAEDNYVNHGTWKSTTQPAM
jgi:hypothetical protein